MFNYDTLVQSMKRHAIGIILITFLAAIFAVSSSIIGALISNGAEDDHSYQAQAELLLVQATSGRQTPGELDSTSRVIMDARRMVSSNEVSGEVRRRFGDKVKIESPYLVSGEKGQEFTSDFVFILVQASNQDLAVSAAKLTSELAQERISKLLPVKEVLISTPAVPVPVTGAVVNSFGAGELSGNNSDKNSLGLKISKKRLLVLTVLGFLFSLAFFASKDALSRKLFTRNDVVRLLDIPVLAEVKTVTELEGMREAFQLMFKRMKVNQPVIAATTDESLAQESVTALSGENTKLSSTYLFGGKFLDSLQTADGLVLVLRAAQDDKETLARTVDTINILQIPVLGCIFLAE